MGSTNVWTKKVETMVFIEILKFIGVNGLVLTVNVMDSPI
jgi:hypothetical protein